MGKLGHHQLEQLVLRARGGDERAFAQLYRATAAAQYYQALSILGDEQLAEDAVQECYLVLHRSLQQLEKPRAVVAFLNRTTYLVCQNIRRAQARAKPVAEADLEQAAQLPSPQDLQLRDTALTLSAAIAKLPQRQRQVLALRYFSQYTVAQIAEMMQCSTSTVDRLLTAAKHALRQQLGGTFALVPMGLLLRYSCRQLPRPALPGSAVAAAVGATAILCVGGVQLAPFDLHCELQQSPAAAILTACIGGIPAQRVELSDSSGRTTDMARGKDGCYTLPISQNGTYTLRAVANTGRVHRRQVTVTDLDRQGPTLAEIRPTEELVYFTVHDDSGLAADSLRAVDARGEATYLDKVEGGCYAAALPNGSYTLLSSDQLGNTSAVPFSLTGGQADRVAGE